MHHIMTDGTSQMILMREFMALYAGESLPDLRIQYKDYACWQDGQVEKGVWAQQETFWVNDFADEIPVLALPYDCPRPAGARVLSGSASHFILEEERSQGVDSGGGRRGRDSIHDVAGAGAGVAGEAQRAGRHRGGYADSGAETCRSAIGDRDVHQHDGVAIAAGRRARRFSEFLGEVRDKTLAAFREPGIPVRGVGGEVEGDGAILGRNPLFDVIFVLQNMEAGRENSAGGDSRTCRSRPSITYLRA